MSHYFALGADGLVDPARNAECAPALAWHRATWRGRRRRTAIELIWSLSLRDCSTMFCPEAWKQRVFDGRRRLTGYDPPSALVSPANADGDCLSRPDRGGAGRDLRSRRGWSRMFQIGEPWWWVDGRPAASACTTMRRRRRSAARRSRSPMSRGALSAAQKALLDAGGGAAGGSRRRRSRRRPRRRRRRR